MKKILSERGYLTNEGYNHFHKIIANRMEREGYIKNGRMNVRFDSKPASIRKGDYVITFEIYKVVKRFEEGTPDEFSVVCVLPCCSVLNCRKKGCLHKCIKHTGLGQQGITKLLKW